MSGKTCHIWPKSPKEIGGEIKVSFLVEPHREKAFEIWFKIPEELKSAVSERSDAFLTAAMFHLMSRNENAKVHGPVTSSLLFGLHNYMSIWHRWNRDLYHVVDLDCEAEVTSPEADGDEAIALYSGGVDASFTALRHARKSAGRFSRNLTTCLMVHGFNISLDDQEHFEQAFGLARESLETLSLPLLSMQTNWWHYAASTVKDTHSSGLAAFLSLFQKRFRVGLFGSTSTYDYFDSWGSHPTCDIQFSSDAFEVISDDSAYSREDKVMELMEWPTGLKNLRVCHHPINGQNCRTCEKCLRTALCFMANGLEAPDCLKVDMTRKILENIQLYEPFKSDMVGRILKRAKEKGIRRPEFDILEKRYKRKMFRMHVRKYLEATRQTKVDQGLWKTLNDHPVIGKVIRKMTG
jgi:hypothetical protein